MEETGGFCELLDKQQVSFSISFADIWDEIIFVGPLGLSTLRPASAHLQN